jgi:predicted dithiol-disulfide oxidoreductase (DUF899 family)
MNHLVVSHDEWLAARTAFLAEEKEFTRQRDELTRKRSELPWEAVEKEYTFDGPNGKETLASIFDGRSQLIVYHFMFPPEWEAGCPHCSFWADNFNEVIIHMNYHDITMVAISRAPSAKLQAYRERMGWSFKWLSSGASDFNYDYFASFTEEQRASKKAYFNYAIQNPGMSDREGASVFYKDEAGRIFHTYSTFARGIDMMNTAYHWIDTTPKGRDEGKGNQYWIRRHDEYDRKP